MRDPDKPRACGLEPKQLEQCLPTLTISEVEQLMGQVNLDEPIGVRDRAILETLCSTGMRHRELIALAPIDIDREHRTVTIRASQGKPDRTLPIGKLALGWIDRYERKVRPGLLAGRLSPVALFLSRLGEPFTPSALTHLVRRYLHAASLQGSSHLLRRTVLSWLLESGADIASIQAMLRSATLSSSQRIEALCQGIEQQTSVCLAGHPIEQRYAALKGRWRDIGAMLELARGLEDQPLVGFLERHQNALRDSIDEEPMQSVEIQVILTEPQARELAQFLKRVYYSDYRQHATSEEAAYQMVNAGERIREALAQAGYAPQ